VPRIGVIGAGAWGRNHVRTFAGLESAELVAVADADERVRARLAREHPGLRCCAAAEELFDDPAIDGLVLATPAPTHAALATAALEAGKHVLVEKPLALDVPAAERLEATARRLGRVLMVGHLLLYHPAVRDLKRRVEAGELGRPLYLYCERVNLGVIRRDENALWSLGPHDLSLALFLLGEGISDVVARGASYLTPGVHDVVFANLRYEDGRMANLHVSWLDPHKSRRVVLVGERKMAVFDDMAAQEKLRIYDKGAERLPPAVGFGEHLTVRSGDILIPKIPASEPLRAEAEAFVEAIRSGAPPLTDGAHGVEVVRLLAAAQASLDAGGSPVAVRASGVGT